MIGPASVSPWNAGISHSRLRSRCRSPIRKGQCVARILALGHVSEAKEEAARWLTARSSGRRASAGGCRGGEGLDGRVGGGEEGFAGCWPLGAGCERPPCSALSRPASRSHRSRAIRSSRSRPELLDEPVRRAGRLGILRTVRRVPDATCRAELRRAADPGEGSLEALAGAGSCVVRGCTLARPGIGSWAGRSGGSCSVGSSAERMLASRWRFSAIRWA